MDERVERGMRRQLASAPDDRIGWKMALNAPAIMEALGLPEPALGWLSRERVAAGEHSLAGARTRPSSLSCCSRLERPGRSRAWAWRSRWSTSTARSSRWRR